MSSRISLRKLLLVCTAATLTTGQILAPATANAAVANNCVAQVRLTTTSPAPVPTCFAKFSDAMAYATGGKIHLVNADNSRQVSNSEMTGATAATVASDSSYVLSIDYKDANFSGASFIWTAPIPCGFFADASMPSGWNDVVSSVAAFNGCAVSLYQNINYGGTRYALTVNGSASSLGSFNDQDSSEEWCSFYPCS